jgi:hypothetical protein
MFVQPPMPNRRHRNLSTSCTDARVEDRTVRRFAGGLEQRTSLTDVNRCVGEIGNENGALTCAVTAANGAVQSQVKDALLAPRLKRCSLLT